GIRLVKSGDLDAARRTLTRAANELVDRGAQGIVYGCTDISAVLGPAPSGIDVPVWDSATALAAASVDYIRSERHAGGTATRKVTHGALCLGHAGPAPSPQLSVGHRCTAWAASPLHECPGR